MGRSLDMGFARGLLAGGLLAGGPLAGGRGVSSRTAFSSGRVILPNRFPPLGGGALIGTGSLFGSTSALAPSVERRSAPTFPRPGCVVVRFSRVGFIVMSYAWLAPPENRAATLGVNNRFQKASCRPTYVKIDTSFFAAFVAPSANSQRSIFSTLTTASADCE